MKDPQAEAARKDVRAVLDRAHARLGGESDVPHVLHELMADLASLRGRLGLERWPEIARAAAREHPLRTVLFEDPFTRRAFEKPRGYPGDAVTLDFLYGHLTEAPSTTRGQAILEAITATRTAEAIRHRCEVLANAIDRVSAERAKARVLVLGCGHLREAQLSAALRDGSVGDLVAVDRDPATLEFVTRTFAGSPVRAIHRKLPARLADLGHFDLIYASGLLDWSPDALARRLVARAFSLLEPGGMLLLANLARDNPETTYLEVVTDWWPVCRTPREVHDLSEAAPAAALASHRVSSDASGVVVYLELRRRESAGAAQAPT